jgi:hypothetical protein
MQVSLVPGLVFNSMSISGKAAGGLTVYVAGSASVSARKGIISLCGGGKRLSSDFTRIVGLRAAGVKDEAGEGKRALERE